jgi:AcrR family transcriptional regulator
MASAAAREPQSPAGHETRQRILVAARALFAEHGYAGTSVRLIARHLRITDPAIYYHFPTKQDLYDALLVLPDYGTLPLDGHQVTREGLINQIVHLFGWWAEQPDFSRMLLREQLAQQEASLAFMNTSEDFWAAAVTEPLRLFYEEDCFERAQMLYEMMAGIFWDAILSYGTTFSEVVQQHYFLQRMRAMLGLAIPESAP